MSRRSHPIPKLCRHKAKSRGVVRLSGQDHYCGPWPADQPEPPPETRATYDRLVGEWLARGRRPVVAPHVLGAQTPAAGPSVNEVLLHFLRHAEQHYRHPDGTTTDEVRHIK